MIGFKTIATLLMLLTLSGCQTLGGSSSTKDEASLSSESLTFNHLMKTDMDMVYDHQVKTLNELLQQLMTKLYLRNPAYFRHFGAESAEARTRYFFQRSYDQVADQFQQQRSIGLMRLAFDESFAGDRVAALVMGLKTMLAESYNHQSDFFVLDQLDPQKLYNAARNIEVAVWKLSHDRDARGELYLVSNELQGDIKNLSFERLFGKMIALQDSSAALNANATNRVIKNVVQGVAKVMFLPL